MRQRLAWLFASPTPFFYCVTSIIMLVLPCMRATRNFLPFKPAYHACDCVGGYSSYPAQRIIIYSSFVIGIYCLSFPLPHFFRLLYKYKEYSVIMVLGAMASNGSGCG